MKTMSADSFRFAHYPGTLAGAHLVRPLHQVADLSTTRLLPRLPSFQYSFGIHHRSAKYQAFAVLLPNRFDAIHIFWPEWSVKTMSLESMRLRLESGDGSPVKEYRIEDGNVEVRSLDPEGGSVRRTGSVWWRLTPEQLSIQVEHNTVVAHWLERRLGWRRLLQACVGQEPSMWKGAENTNHPAP